MIEKSVWSVGENDIDKEEQKHCEEERSRCHFVQHNLHITRSLIRTRKTYSSATLCTTNPTYTGLWYGQGKSKYFFKNLFQCQTVHHKSHIYRSLIRTGKAEVLVHKPIPVPHCAPQIPHTQVFDSDAKNRSSCSKTYSSATLCTTNSTYTGLWFGRGNPKYLERTMSQCYFVHRKS